jgi:hypothetical protein
LTIPVRIFRELLRHLQVWQALYEAEGVDTLTGPDGTEYCLHDIHQLYRVGVPMLSHRQRQAIRWFLIENRSEREVACMMGVSADNPVASYATQGLCRLNELIEAGQIPRYQPGELRQEAA